MHKGSSIIRRVCSVESLLRDLIILNLILELRQNGFELFEAIRYYRYLRLLTNHGEGHSDNHYVLRLGPSGNVSHFRHIRARCQ